jgi:hypothetical protein
MALTCIFAHLRLSWDFEGGALCVLFVHSVSPLEAIIHKL